MFTIEFGWFGKNGELKIYGAAFELGGETNLVFRMNPPILRMMSVRHESELWKDKFLKNPYFIIDSLEAAFRIGSAKSNL